MTYRWHTTKTAQGFRWSVTSFEYGVGSKTLHAGIVATRAQAEGAAKRTVMPYRRQCEA